MRTADGRADVLEIQGLARSRWVPPAIDADVALGVADTIDDGGATPAEVARAVGAEDVAGADDVAGVEQIADVGGGYGALLPPVLAVHPGATGIVVDLVRCAEGARRSIA
jgi:hypothetical protein